MARSFSEKLALKCKNSPYRETLSNILFMDELLSREPDMDPSSFLFNYSLFSDREIDEMGMLSRIGNARELKSAISNVRRYISKSYGDIDYASRDLFGVDSEYSEFLDVFSFGVFAWCDVVGECEKFVDGLEKDEAGR
ncbi:MAG: hypothetical protein ABH863_06235 [Candidatus Micrarchaeota archaeon]